MVKPNKSQEKLSKFKVYLILAVGLIILIGSAILFWQIQKQTTNSSSTENLALKNQIDDLNKKIDSLNKTIEEVKNASPTVETKTYVKTSSGKLAGEQATNIEGRVNINSATVGQLDSLPGIGKTYAERIVEYRERNGGFKSIEDIKNVKGIGDKTFEKFKNMITI